MGQAAGADAEARTPAAMRYTRSDRVSFSRGRTATAQRPSGPLSRARRRRRPRAAQNNTHRIRGVMAIDNVFDYSFTLNAGKREAAAPPPVRRIVIVGGGTAGWMTALIFAQSLIPRGVEITLLESPAVPTIGVGEGSTPLLRGFFDLLKIEEAEWMPSCHATYKCGISFDGWSSKPGFERCFHPFP